MVRGLADIGAEGILLAGGARAILLQIAHPAIGRGVAEHSDFASRPLDRLRATMTYVYSVVYGTPAQVEAARRRVNEAHRRVRAPGTDGYSAYDPELQLWVAATLYDTAVLVYERVYGPLDQASAERIYADYAVLGTTLQMPLGLWPTDRTAFNEYWRRSLRNLQVQDAARSVATDLLHPPTAPRWLRAVMPLVRLLTAGLLPQPLREAYGLPWDDRSQRSFDRWLRFAAKVYPHLPRRVRHGLKARYLKVPG